MRTLAPVIVVAVAGTSCGGRDGDDGWTSPAPDAGAVLDGGGEIDLEAYLAENGVHRLTLRDDGIEVGSATADAGGVVRFFSDRHAGLFDFSIAEEDLEMPIAGAEVSVAASETGVAYVVRDPAGRYTPLIFTSAIPETDTAMTVDGVDLIEAGGGVLEFDPEDGDPFASAPFTILGLSFTMSWRMLLVGLGAGVAIEAFKTLIQSTCAVIAPLHAERCALIGTVASAVAGVIAGFFLPGTTVWSLGGAVLGPLLDDYVCNPAGGAVVGYLSDPDDTSMRDRYRQAARKLNYLLWKMENEPVAGQPSWEVMTEHARSFARMSQVVRNRYFQLWNAENVANDSLVGGSVGTAAEGASRFFNFLPLEAQREVLVGSSFNEEVRAFLRIGEYDARLTVQRFRWTTTFWEEVRFDLLPGEVLDAIFGLFAGCTLAFLHGAVIGWVDAAGAHETEVSTEQLIGAELEVWERGLDALHARLWGGSIPMGSCLADEWESNGSWEAAVASPVPVTLGDPSVVELMDVTLCDGPATSSAEDDWYAYSVAPIEFNVAARVIGVEGGLGQDEEVCLDVYFYSEIYQLTESPPDRITGVCGRVRDWPATEPFSIRRTVGESWSTMLIHVRPGPSATGAPVQYGLRFTP